MGTTKTMLTPKSVTATQLRQLAREATFAGDYAMAAIADLALLGEFNPDDYTCLDRRSAERIAGMTPQRALAACCDALNDQRGRL